MRRKLLRWIVKALHTKAEPWEVALARRRHNAYLREHDPLWRAASAWGRQITREYERWRQRQKMGLLGAGEAEGYQPYDPMTQRKMLWAAEQSSFPLGEAQQKSVIPSAGPKTQAERLEAIVESTATPSYPFRKE